MAHDRALKRLDRSATERRTAFSAADVREALGTSPQATSNVLARWIRMGLVDRLAVGRYAIRQIGSLGTAAVWDDLGSAVAAVFAGHPHRIGYLTALDHHGLLVRPVRAIQIASPYRPREKTLTGQPLRVVREGAETVLVGTELLGPSRAATVPRALLDAASRRHLVGGTTRVTEALAAADDVAGLRDLASKVNADPAYRRIGSLATTLSMPVAQGLEPPAWRSLIQLRPLSVPTMDGSTRRGPSLGHIPHPSWRRWLPHDCQGSHHATCQRRAPAHPDHRARLHAGPHLLGC